MGIFNFVKTAIFGLGVKPLKNWIDDTFRDKVVPVEGSVLYVDLYVVAEHSGIYIGNNEIANIVVDGFAEASVENSSPEDFTDSSKMYSKIYISCNSDGAVGDKNVSRYAQRSIGESGFYGLVFSNCHAFSEKCVKKAHKHYNSSSIFDTFDETWEPTIRSLKKSAREKLNATKWRLWDWKEQEEGEEEQDATTPEPNIEEMLQQLQNISLDEKSSQEIKKDLVQTQEYLEEISDENIPQEALSKLITYKNTLEDVNAKYEYSKVFIEQMGHGFSYNELMQMGNVDFQLLAKELESNVDIQKIIQKLGRNYISEEKKETISKKLPNEIHSIHKSNELSRLLPIELSSIDDEDLEYLFYAKYLENSLLTYKLEGEKISFKNLKTKGPVVALLDTSGSMNGTPLLKAKALLLAVSKILDSENRELYIILFGASNQIKELHIKNTQESNKMMAFISQGFNGGTDFETPLQRSFEIIESHNNFENADILMVTDGICSISDSFKEKLTKQKEMLSFDIYTIICDSSIVEDNFSSEVFSI